jgi:hypothetical protein
MAELLRNRSDWGHLRLVDLSSCFFFFSFGLVFVAARAFICFETRCIMWLQYL